MEENVRLLSVDEVGEYLGLSWRSIYRLLESGQLSGYKLGRVWRFRPEDVESYLARCRAVRGTSSTRMTNRKPR